jgi:hypothetical protein
MFNLQKIDPPLESERQDFLKSFGIQTPQVGVVECNLAGRTYNEFCLSANEMGRRLFGRDLIDPTLLDSLAFRPEFNQRVSLNSTPLRINSNFFKEQNDFMTRDDQFRGFESQGRESAVLEDGVVGHIAYTLATGRDLFNGGLGFAVLGSLYVSTSGLDVWSFGNVLQSPGMIIENESKHDFSQNQNLLQ